METPDILKVIQSLNEDDKVRVGQTADVVLRMVKGERSISVMPAVHLPKTGMLLMVHPDVYSEIKTRIPSHD